MRSPTKSPPRSTHFVPEKGFCSIGETIANRLLRQNAFGIRPTLCFLVRVVLDCLSGRNFCHPLIILSLFQRQSHSFRFVKPSGTLPFTTIHVGGHINGRGRMAAVSLLLQVGKGLHFRDYAYIKSPTCHIGCLLCRTPSSLCWNGDGFHRHYYYSFRRRLVGKGKWGIKFGARNVRDYHLEGRYAGRCFLRAHESKNRRRVSEEGVWGKVGEMGT
ncbi:hypothetical protein IW262DRAFT_851301 [Armillaria fumosa]|nr:hypothetical protein IW262DRAFT_851301 [Armillaria fumosa]